MMRTVSLLFVLLVICEHSALAETNYSKTAELPPLRTSFADLQPILDKSASLMIAANGPTPIWLEDIQLRKGNLRIKHTGRQLIPDGARIPNSIESVEYSARTRDSAPISRVALDFSDYKRTLSVEGQSPEHVDAIFSALRDDLIKLSTFVGGSGLKTFLGFPAIWLLVTILVWPAVAWFQTRRRILLLPVSICIALIAALLLLPLDDLLAGFIAVRGDASFLARFGPEISFWGLVVGAISIPVTLVPLFYRGVPKSDVVAPNSAHKGTRKKRRAP